ncbi:MAG: OmpP1/FadL family transporter [Cyclonatronaceae bacterium]
MKKIAVMGLLCLVLAGTAHSQNRFDALRFSTVYPSQDAANMGLAGASVAGFHDLGSALQNPATLALSKTNLFSFGLSSRQVSEEAVFLNQTRNFDDGQTSIANLGFLYSVPTDIGSLVFAGTYNHLADFNRAFRFNGFNATSSITDAYLISDFYGDVAFDAFAIDVDENTGEEFSVLRLFTDEPFDGITQSGRQIERGQIGEFGFSAATEFQENLFMGLTISLPLGSYSYRRVFLEEDLDNVHDNTGNSYDVDNIFSVDRINADISGYGARLGILYRINPQFNIGFSYTTPMVLNIEESYTTAITTTFDNGDVFDAELNGSVTYKVVTPSRFVIGGSAFSLGIADLHASVEYVDYSSVKLKDLDDVIEFEEEDRILEEFDNVFNVRLGAELKLGDVLRPRVGLALMPSPLKNIDMQKSFLTAGLGIVAGPNFQIDLGLQYGVWDDENTFYNHFDYLGTGQLNAVGATQSVERVNFMLGMKFNF